MNWISSKNKNFALGKTWLNKNTSHRLGKKTFTITYLAKNLQTEELLKI